MQQQNLAYNSLNNQQLYMQHEQTSSNQMQQNQQHHYQQPPGNPVNQQSYQLHPQSINSHPLYPSQYQIQPQAQQQLPLSPYQRPQQQYGQYPNQNQQIWGMNKQQFQPSMQMSQQHPNIMNQNVLATSNEQTSQREINHNYMRPPGLGDQYVKAPAQVIEKKNDTMQRNNSPPNEDTGGGGYFLPDFIANEIDSKSPPCQQIQKQTIQNLANKVSQGSDDSAHLRSGSSAGENANEYHQSFYQASKKVCTLCNQDITSYEQVIDRISEQTGQLQYTHLNCLAQHSLTQGHEKDDPRLSYQSIVRGISQTISPQPKSILSPDMLIFDFQLLHPMTQTNIFQLSNQSANYIYDQQNSTFLYNKLLCNTTAVPFNMAIVKLRWDFLRDPATIIDPYQQSIAYPNLPQSQHNNMIQGLINFNDMHNHNDKNITITLKSQPLEQTFLSMSQASNSTLHLNFNYTNFQEQPYDIQQQQIPKHFLPITHLIKNLYLSFVLSTKDYEILKDDTMRMIQQNPALVSLLKPNSSPVQGQQRFVSTQPGSSLHSLFQGAQDSMFSPLAQQMQQMNINQNPTLSPSGMSMQQNYNSPMKTQEVKRSSGSPSTYEFPSASRLENQGSERKIQLDQLQMQTLQPKRAPSENQLFVEETKRREKDGGFYQNQYGESLSINNHNQAEESQSLRKALTCNFEVSTFDGEAQRKMILIDQQRNVIKNDQSQSVGGSPKQNLIDSMSKGASPTNLSTGGSTKNLFATDEKTDFLNPSTLQKQKSIKVSKSKKGELRKGSSGSGQSGKLSKKSTSSVKSGGSSSKSASSMRIEECDSENAQIMAELKGQVVETARQQHGSKYLQKLLARASPDFVGFAIDESIYHLHELMVDQYGNYFCQKLLQSSSSAQRNKILQVLCPNILKISCDRKGTHSMQCLIEMINMPDEEEALKNGIKDRVIDLAFDSNGTHVLQKVMLCMKEENIDFIFNPVLENLIELSMDQNGLCVIKKIIAKIQGHDKRMKIGKKLSEHVVELVQSPYGNYAVQQALDNWPIQYCESIFEKLEPHLMQLSVQKFSSNVIEKVLENSTYETVERYMNALCEHEVMKSLIKNTYGFYVIQKLKEVLKRHGKTSKKISQAIEGTIQYVSDKTLKLKWQQLMTQI